MGPTDSSRARTSDDGKAARLVAVVFVPAALVLLLVYFSRPERVRELILSTAWLKAVLKIWLVHGV